MLYRCIAAIPNAGGGAKQRFYQDTPEGHAIAESFAREHDRPGMGVFDCVSPLRSHKRSKDNIAQIEGLHADIDCYKLGKTKEEVVKELTDNLSSFGILSRINSSGRGVHPYFFFREPIEAGTPEYEKAETALKRLVSHLGADPQPAHFAALMRRAGTTNSKENGGPCETLLDTGARCELADIEAYLDLVSAKEPLFRGEHNGDASGGENENGPVDIETRLAAMEFGNKDRGINKTVPSVIATLIWRAWHPDDIHKKIVDAIMAAGERAGQNWNRAAEVELTTKRIGSAYQNLRKQI